MGTSPRYTYSDADTHPEHDPDLYDDSIAYENSDPVAIGNSNPDSECDTDSNTIGNADTVSDPNTLGYPDTVSHPHAYSKRNADSDSVGYTNAYSEHDPDPNYADTDTKCDTNSSTGLLPGPRLFHLSRGVRR